MDASCDRLALTCGCNTGVIVRIAIVGAGIAGLASAKVLLQAGFDVTVLDRTPDVGGVWSATRRYPGLRTQNSKRAYGFADLPMPAHYPELPNAEQMQAYLANYADQFELGERIHLGIEVVSASAVTDGWSIAVRDMRSGATEIRHCEHLIVANGVFSDPAIPDYPGINDFVAGGGRVCAPSQFHDLAEATGKHMVVVGYGKSACDIAQAVSHVAKSTTVIARRLLWKMPQQVDGIGSAEDLMLTRLGEAGFGYIDPNRFERFYNGPARRIRDSVFDLLGWRINRQLGLRELQLMPDGGFDQIALSSPSFVTDGFYEGVAAGRIIVHRDATITGLYARPTPEAQLSSGIRVPAEIILCATGFRQRLPFLDQGTQERLSDGNGNICLYRQILPFGVPALTFAGYNLSLTSALTAEIEALWTAALLTGQLELPAETQQRADVAARLQWVRQRANGVDGRWTAIIPFSIHTTDELLADLDIYPGRVARASQWLRPVYPEAYQRHLELAASKYRVSVG